MAWSQRRDLSATGRWTRGAGARLGTAHRRDATVRSSMRPGSRVSSSTRRALRTAGTTTGGTTRVHVSLRPRIPSAGPRPFLRPDRRRRSPRRPSRRTGGKSARRPPGRSAPGPAARGLCAWPSSEWPRDRGRARRPGRLTGQLAATPAQVWTRVAARSWSLTSRIELSSVTSTTFGRWSRTSDSSTAA